MKTPPAHLDDLRFRLAAYADAFLDGDVMADRLEVWTDRLREPGAARCTIVAEGGEGLVAFAHTAFEDDPAWGALLDNLHVAFAHKRRGIGSQLLALTAQPRRHPREVAIRVDRPPRAAMSRLMSARPRAPSKSGDPAGKRAGSP